MSDSPDSPDLPASPGAAPGPDVPGAREGGSASGGGGSGDRSRNRSGGGSRGGRGSSGQGGGQGGGQDGRRRSGKGAGQGRNRSGGQGSGTSPGGKSRAGSASGDGRGGGRSSGRGPSRASSGSRRNSGGGSSNRGGPGRGSGSRADTIPTGPGSDLAVPARAPAGTVDRGPEGVEEASAIRSNRRRAITLCLLPGLAAGLIVVIVLVSAGLPLFGAAGFVLVVAVLSLWLYRTAPGTVARAVGARPSSEWEQPRLHNLVDGLCATMGLPRPAIAVVESPVPNAMALGRDPASAVLVVTSGLDQALSLVELEGVLAHELVHIKRHDALLAGVAVIVAVPWSAIRGIANGTATVHHLIGRGREFSADQRAAAVVRYPAGIRSALDTMVDRPWSPPDWPPGGGRTAALTRWLWFDPLAGGSDQSMEDNLDDTRVRAAALSLY